MGFIHSQLFVTPAYPNKSFKDQTVIVTGSNTGLGLESVRHYIRLGAAKVIIAVRNLEAGEKAKASVEEESGRTGVCEVWELDLASYASVMKFADRANDLARLDVLLENAGISTTKFSEVEGHERTVTVNVVSTFLLFFLLLPKLRATKKQHPQSEPHLCVVSSEVHGWAKFPEKKANNIFATLDDPKNPNMSERYMTSKLLEVLVMKQITPKINANEVVANFVNPGLCHSELTREMGIGMGTFMVVFKKVLARTGEVGARNFIQATSLGQEAHGKYISDGMEKDYDLSKFVTSEDGAKVSRKLWAELKEILEKIKPGVTAGF